MMKDEEYLFHSEVRAKKVTARSARNTRTHNGKSGRVKLPSDYMTKKELNAMNGEVKSYRLNEPMSWKEFKAMPDDIKVTYVKLLREKFHCIDSAIAEMMGIHKATFHNEMNRLGIMVGGKGRRKWEDKDAFWAWVSGARIPVEEAKEEPVPEEPVPEEVEQMPEFYPVETHEEQEAVVFEEKKAIPCTGNMVYEGKVEEVMNSVAALLGNAYVHISITWDVLPEPIRGCEADG